MGKKKLITCLDVRDGILTKGVKFLGNKDIGDPVEAAKKYCEQGIDEIVFYDITATHENRSTSMDIAAKVAAQITVPFAIGGGIRSLEDFRAAIAAGANKVHINSAAVREPDLIAKAAQEFGPDCVVLSMDVQNVGSSPAIPSGFEVVTNGGRNHTGMDAVEWAKRGVELGACEIVLNSIDGDGTQAGYDIPLHQAVAKVVNVPVVASGGAGTIQHIYDVLTEGDAQVALIASMLHFGEYTVTDIKNSPLCAGLFG